MLAARRANELSEHARSTALDIEQNNTVNFGGPKLPGHYDSAHPQNFISGTMQFDRETMSFESRLAILNMGPSNCFRLVIEVSSSTDADFSMSTTKALLRPGESIEFPMQPGDFGLPADWSLSIRWRDEMGVDHEQTAGLEPSGYFAGVRTNAR
jgi:hypothetical protein